MSIFIDTDRRGFHLLYVQMMFANITLKGSDLTSHLLIYLVTYLIIEFRFSIEDILVLMFQANKNTAMKVFKMISSCSIMYL